MQLVRDSRDAFSLNVILPETPGRCRVQLKKNNRLVSHVELTDHRETTFDRLQEGDYELEVTGSIDSRIFFFVQR
jgi:hypothetical protein